MIRHVVCFQLREAGLLGQWLEGSARLKEIETVRSFEAVQLLNQQRYHCALYMEFSDRKALAIYQAHPIHQHYLGQVLPRLVCDKLVVDLMGSPPVAQPAAEL